MEIISFRRFHDAVDDLAGDDAFDTGGEQEIFTPDDKFLYGPLGPIIGYFQASVFEEAYQKLPLIQRVENRGAQT